MAAMDSYSTPQTARHRVLLVTGVLGAGKSTALRALEDMGWETIDNFPIRLLDRLLETGPGSARIDAGAPVAIGSRALDRTLIGVHQPGFRETAGKVFNAIMRVSTGMPIADTQCGFKLFRQDVARQVFSRQLLERFGFDVEVLFIAKKLGYRISEVPVRWNHAEGSKVGMFTGLHAFAELAQVRINDWRGRYS